MSSYHIYIELNTRRVYLKKGSQLIHTFPVAIGKSATPTPIGNFKIINKIANPGGVLGTRWMQFTHQNHGLHGTNQPWLIGQAVSNGCVRMYNQDVEKIYPLVSVGTPLTVSNNFQFGGGGSGGKNPGNPGNPGNPANPGNPGNPGYFIYTVKRGDSLWKISQRYGITVAQLRTANNLQGDLIYPGQKLKIPSQAK